MIRYHSHFLYHVQFDDLKEFAVEDHAETGLVSLHNGNEVEGYRIAILTKKEFSEWVRQLQVVDQQLKNVVG